VQMHVDHGQIFRPITKATLRLTPETARQATDEAIRLALAERPGPVHLDLPVDVAEAPDKGTGGTDGTEGVRGFAPASIPLPSAASLRRAAALLQQARKPLLVLGLGLTRARAQEELARFLQRHRLPVLTTFMAKGLVPEDSPLCAGVLGGRKDRLQELLAQADLIVAVGYDPVEVAPEEWAPPGMPILRLDTVPADLGPLYPVAGDCLGDLRCALAYLAEVPPCHHAWNLDTLRRGTWEALATDLAQVKGFAPHHVLEALREALPRDGILACDVGAHAHLVRQFWPAYEPGTLLVSNGWSSMGFGIPAAIAARLILPRRRVACLVGDGGLLMMMGELWTAARLRLPVVFTALVDGELTLIRHRQERKGVPIHGTALFPPDAAPIRLSGGGVTGVIAHSLEGYRRALREAFARDHPTLIQAVVDPAEYRLLV